MNFDYTYITLFGFRFFEPVVLLTNTIMFVLGLIYFLKLRKSTLAYARQAGWFMFLLGAGTLVGGVGHTVHMQLGALFFRCIVFVMNAFSLFSIYAFFRASYTYLSFPNPPSKKYMYLALSWVLVVLVISALVENFTIIKIHAGIALIYALVAHYIVYVRRKEKGSAIVVTGILISFLPIIVHSLKLSFGEWFNHKDIAHTIMIISLIVIYKGVVKISSELAGDRGEDRPENI
jgi:hypothetical protein